MRPILSSLSLWLTFVNFLNLRSKYRKKLTLFKVNHSSIGLNYRKFKKCHFCISQKRHFFPKK